MKKLLIVLGMTLLFISLACGTQSSELENQILKEEIENLEISLTELNAEINLLKWDMINLSNIIESESLSEADLNDSLNKAYIVNRNYVDNSIHGAYAEIDYLETRVFSSDGLSYRVDQLEDEICSLAGIVREDRTSLPDIC